MGAFYPTLRNFPMPRIKSMRARAPVAILNQEVTLKIKPYAKNRNAER